MKEFIESNLHFQFNEDNWQVVKYDEEEAYINASKVLPGTKAIDFLSVYNNRSLILFEIKNFRGYSTQAATQQRMKNAMDELSTEIAQKVRDSIAVICGVNKNTPYTEDNLWCKSAKYLFDEKQIMVISWIEEDETKATKAEMGIRTDKLKTKLSWLTKYVFIENVKARHINFDGLTVVTTIP